MTDIYNQAISFFKPEQKKKEWYEEIEEEVCSICPKMTYQQRIIGCVSCLILGFLLSMGSCFRLLQLIAGEPTPFAIMYTIGNILSISATCFLFGPWTQAKKMFAQTRLITTCVYFTMMAITLFFVFYPGDLPGRVFLVIIAIFLQFLALIWYTLSFIPFARDIVSNFLMDWCCVCLKNDNQTWFWRLWLIHQCMCADELLDHD